MKKTTSCYSIKTPEACLLKSGWHLLILIAILLTACRLPPPVYVISEPPLMPVPGPPPPPRLEIPLPPPDESAFWQEGYSAVMVTDTAMFRYPHYHDPEDTIDKLDFERMARVVRGLEKVVGELVGGNDTKRD